MKITCPHCKQEIEVEEAISHDIETNKLQEIQEQITNKLKKEYENKLKAEKANLESEKENFENLLETEKKKLQIELEGKNKSELSKLEIELATLKSQDETSKKRSEALQEKVNQLLDHLAKAKESESSAKAEALKQLEEKEKYIRQKAIEEIEEEYRLKLLEKEKTISDMQKSIDDAKRTSQLASQQLQGEVLELDLENLLKQQFPLDDIIPIAKGVNGADIKQIVKNPLGYECGIILWEAKNAKWQKTWIDKFIVDIQNAKANIGVLVAIEPANNLEFNYATDNIIVVKRRFAMSVAKMLRRSILDIHTANQNSVNKDEKLESLYQYITGNEFKNRLQTMASSFKLLSDELEKEKKQTQQRWAKQQKAIDMLTGNTNTLYGELQCLTSEALLPPPDLAIADDDE